MLVRIPDGVALPFVIHKVEKFIFLDGPAEGAAELFQSYRLFVGWREVGRVEVVAGVEGRIATIGVT